MLPRVVTAAFLLSVAIAFPVISHAGECQEVVVFFNGGREVLDVINLGQASNTNLGFLFFQNDGIFVCDTLMPIGPRARVSISARDVYGTASCTPPLAASYVKVRLAPLGPMSATVTQGNTTRELACVTP